MKFITLASLTAVLCITFPGNVMGDYNCNGRHIPISLLQENVNSACASFAAVNPNFLNTNPENKIYTHKFLYKVPETINEVYIIVFYFNKRKQITYVEATFQGITVSCLRIS
ncbi:unnamed protein product [Blumeria hordei]|uniref:Uncharacterized protein n=2 Tax=Blumeria hordei TaxID=2867405 RepID=A0A383UMP2_BLUHO|nr:CSEP0485 putative effector protein [Blumeria hordei DH14]CCU83222.1 CSEP0262 putative effector protein [Blumeria hordei DH14]SZF00968.1 unnamed protein product [Blumeria hordei]